MACEIQAGRLEPCKTVGGLKAVYFAPFDSDNVPTLNTGTFTGFSSGSAQFFKWELRGANTMDETNESSRENGTSFYTGAGTFQFKKIDAKAIAELEKLSKGTHYVMTEGYDGTMRIYGLEDGCEISASTASGSAMGDFSGFNVTVASLATYPAPIADGVLTNITYSSTFLNV